MMVDGWKQPTTNERRREEREEFFLDREFSLEFLHKKERDVYIKDELFFFF